MAYLTPKQVKERVKDRFKCRTIKGNGIRPDKIPIDVYGNHASYVEDGFRYWGFVSQQGRDMFVEDFEAEKL